MSGGMSSGSAGSPVRARRPWPAACATLWLRRYNPDTQTWSHLAQALAQGDPAARRAAEMSPAERAAAAPEEIDYARGHMMLDDLRSLPTAFLVLAEASPPEPGIAFMGQAVSLIPTQAVQRSRLASRHPQGVPLRYLRSWQTMTEELQGPAPMSSSSTTSQSTRRSPRSSGSLPAAFQKDLRPANSAATSSATPTRPC
jgi:hypothetical protein